jgi:hypothetical protein
LDVCRGEREPGGPPRSRASLQLRYFLMALLNRALRRARSTTTSPAAASPWAPSPLALAGAAALCVAPLGWLALQHGPLVPDAPPAAPWGDAALAGLLPPALSRALACGDQAGARRAFLGWSAVLLAALGAVHAGGALAAAAGACSRPPLHRLRFAAAAVALVAGGAAAGSPPAAGAARDGALRRHHVLMVAHLALHGVEEALKRARPPAFPGWYMHARAPVTAGAVVAHAVAAYLGADPSVADSRRWEAVEGRR